MRRRTAVVQAWASQPDPLLALARQELTFYARACDRARWLHYTTELGALATTSATVVAAGLHAPAWLTALIAGGAVFFTGMRQLFSPGSRWVLAAQSRESLRRAVDRYLLLPPADRDADVRAALQRAIEDVGNNELRGWAEVQGQCGDPQLPAAGA
nr:SLATT domain-containing protein [Streptomyces sp. NBC_00886]